MKATFDDFINKYSNCKRFENNLAAIHIFEKILSNDENIIAMIEASKTNTPALFTCIDDVEDYYQTNEGQAFDLTNNFTKQALGKMVATILEPYGYLPHSRKKRPKTTVPWFVKSAHYYDFSGNVSTTITNSQ